MAELSTLARPYAKAAFQAALDAGALVKWSEMLGYAGSVTQSAEMGKLLSNPGFTDVQQAQALIDVCGADQLNEGIKNLMFILAENKRLSLLPQIAEQYESLKAEQEKAVDVSIVSAFDLAEDQTHKLTQALKAKLNKDVRVTTSTDSSLVGGVIIRAGDLVIDGSVRGKLAKLAEAMNS
ncbi:MAG: F0F1 ATP synthase subunit delta [Oceanospirillaceae bacterium]|nr:F0F1 ATP synthase subunit delta [Oceanospirillaceae bacterium]MCP5334650.1 F0F1 ATP synthase subunit delta [Oceanospirillaceae bacterium]MCP5351364.1 F0F1 ATP synthase subunit delta [Oceanospirillaceae bacterium]